MKKYGWYVIIALFTVISLIITLPGCVRVNTGETAQLISDDAGCLCGQRFQAVNPANTFPVNTENIYVSLKLNNAPANTQITGKLTYLGGEAASMANSTLFNQTLTGQGTKYLSFSIKPPPGGFPQGNYQASLSANGQELASLPFTVQNLSATPGGPIISKFTAIPDTVAAGQPVTLTWDTSNATRVTLQPEVGTLPTSGTRTITPMTTTPVGQFKTADPHADGVGEGALFVAEKFTFQKLAGNGRAVHGDEGLVPAVAVVMDRLGDQLLPRSAFSQNQDRTVRIRDLLHDLEDLLDPFAVADDVLKAVFLFELAAEMDILPLQIPVFEGALEGHQDFIHLDGLGQVIKSPHFDRFHRILNGPVPRQNNAEGIRRVFADVFQDLHAVECRASSGPSGLGRKNFYR